MTLIRASLRGFMALALAGVAVGASAQDTKIAFQLDWRFEGPSAMFLLPKAKGYFAAEKLDVTVDAGNGSGNGGYPTGRVTGSPAVGTAPPPWSRARRRTTDPTDPRPGPVARPGHPAPRDCPRS